MRRPKNTRYFTFEGAERTTSEIAREFFPNIPNGTLYTRLITSGAQTVDEYMAYMSTGKKAPVRGEAVPDNRFSRQVRSKTDELVKEKGCNFCQKMRPVDQLKKANRNRLICVYCDKDRTRTMSRQNQQVVEYQTVSKYIKDKDELLKDCMKLLTKFKGDRHLWNGDTGLTTAHREDINDITKRFIALNLDGGGV